MAKQLHISDLLDIYGSLLTEKQQRLLEYYYNDDLSLAEIAENEGITRQAVRDTLKRAAAQLEQTEKLLGIYKQNAANQGANAEGAADGNVYDADYNVEENNDNQ